MRAGALRHRLAVTSDGGTTDATAGTHTGVDTTVCEPFAEITPATAAKFAALRAVYPALTWAAEVRFGSDTGLITTGQMATWSAGNRTFEVLGAMDPDGRRTVIHIALVDRGLPRQVVP